MVVRVTTALDLLDELGAGHVLAGAVIAKPLVPSGVALLGDDNAWPSGHGVTLHIEAYCRAIYHIWKRMGDITHAVGWPVARPEAGAIRRELAAARPDAFRPNLAVSLAVLANCFEALERDEEALVVNHEAIATLSPPFLSHPPAFAHWMGPIARGYVRRCGKLGREPDGELLGPIVEALEGLELGGAAGGP